MASLLLRLEEVARHLSEATAAEPFVRLCLRRVQHQIAWDTLVAMEHPEIEDVREVLMERDLATR